jgi:nitrite reductase (NADH) large subunit
LRDENYFKANNVNFFNNQEVDSIQFDNKQVMCKSGRTFEYDKLIIATGLSSIGMDAKSGSSLKGIFTLRTLEDSTNIVNYFNELKSKLDEGKKVNVVTYGGSFIAM